MKKFLRLEFKGRNMARKKFLLKCNDDISIFLIQSISKKLAIKNLKDENYLHIAKNFGFYATLREIFKNIYDHNGNWGYAEFELKNNIVYFNIGNSNNPNPDTNEHQPNKKVNFGLGSTYFEAETTKIIFIEFASDTTKNYLHQSTYRLYNPDQ